VLLFFGVAMLLVWDEENTAHLARHRVDPALAERIFTAEDRLMFAAEDDPGRFIIEGTVDGKIYRLVFALAGPDLVYPSRRFALHAPGGGSHEEAHISITKRAG
jgi:uncharacterized DUF497 family protein